MYLPEASTALCSSNAIGTSITGAIAGMLINWCSVQYLEKHLFTGVSIILDWKMDWNGRMDYGMDHFSIVVPGSAVWMFISFNGCIPFFNKGDSPEV